MEVMITDLSRLEIEVGRAKNTSGFVIVSEEIYEHLLAGQVSQYMHYKGVKVYPPNTKAKVEAHEALPIDEKLKVEARMKAEANA